jgi:hypothetical protein
MTYCLSTSLHSFLASWEFYDIQDLSEKDYDNMLEVIRGQGLKEETTGAFHKWYGTREEILKMINAIEFSTHAGPSFEDYDDEMFDNIVGASLTDNELPYRVHEVK